MTGFWDRVLGRNRDQSARTAKDRLQFVLFHDRINLPPERLQAMKEEILAVISKYVDVASDQVDIALEQRDREHSVMRAEIPFLKSRDMQDTVTGAIMDEMADTAATSPLSSEADEDSGPLLSDSTGGTSST